MFWTEKSSLKYSHINGHDIREFNTGRLNFLYAQEHMGLLYSVLKLYILVNLLFTGNINGRYLSFRSFLSLFF